MIPRIHCRNNGKDLKGFRFAQVSMHEWLLAIMNCSICRDNRTITFYWLSLWHHWELLVVIRPKAMWKLYSNGMFRFVLTLRRLNGEMCSIKTKAQRYPVMECQCSNYMHRQFILGFVCFKGTLVVLMMYNKCYPYSLRKFISYSFL